MSDAALATVPASTELVLDVEQAREFLARALRIDEVKDVRDKALAIRLYTRERGAGVEAQNDAAEIALRAERRLGEILRELPKAQTRGLRRGTKSEPRSDGQGLAALGVDKALSSRAQKLAAVPEPAFEKHVQSVRAKGSRLTTSGAIAAVSSSDDYDSDEWYTPAEYIERARAVLGEIDLDPASCPFAQETVRAARYHTKTADGLVQPWAGRVWLNPPYSMPLVRDFTAKLAHEHESGNVPAAICLVNNATDAAWFQRLLASFTTCFPSGRLGYMTRSGPHNQNRQGQAFFYLGPNVSSFTVSFGEIGTVVRRIRP